MMHPDDPPFLTVGTEVSAKYKGAFCEAKVNKVVKNVKIKVNFKYGNGSAVVLDDAIKGVLKIGAHVKALHPDKSQQLDGIVTKIQDCSQYTVVFDDGDITTLRRSSLCLKSGRHFAESETLDQLPLTHPEHFGTPVVGGSRSRGRRSRHHADSDVDSSEDEEEINVRKRHRSQREEWESDIGKVVCVEIGDKKKQKDNWFPGLVVAPTAQDTVKIETKKDYLVRSFQDGRYYTVPKKEATNFCREVGMKVCQSSLRTAVDKALVYIDRNDLPPHWDRDILFGVDISDMDIDREWDSDSSDDETREEKDHFVAQLYKYMEECGTPINKGPTVGTKDLDLYKLFNVVQKLGGFNRVMNQNQWKVVAIKMCLHNLGTQSGTLVKSAYKRYLQSFDDFYRKLGCTMVSSPRGSKARHRSGRSLIRVCDKRPSRKRGGETDSAEETDKKDEDTEGDEKTGEDSEERKKKEDPLARRSTPLRTMSPTTREKAKEQLRPTTRPQEIRLRNLSGKGSSRESSKESLRGEDFLKKRETKEEIKKTRVEELKKTTVIKLESESEGEIDEAKLLLHTQTRSLRNREEKDKEKETEPTLRKSLEKKLRQDHHQRSTSCNSTSSGTSCTSTCTSSSANNLTDSAKNNSLKSKFVGLKSQSPMDDFKKRGRKKKEESNEGQAASGKELLPPHIPICVGHKLKVLYGPNNKESKITYEAKVLEVEESCSWQKMYYVHYSGWNSRYDEWVVRQRVAQNLSWCLTRSKKARSVSKEEEKEKTVVKEGEKEKPEKKEDRKEKEVQQSPRSNINSKRGKPVKLTRSDSTSSTRSSVKSEKASPAHTRSSASVEKTKRRRSKRNSLPSSAKNTEDSASEGSESGLEVSSEKKIVLNTRSGNSPTLLNFKSEVTKERINVKDESQGKVDIDSCGKDIDMKAIESEMKGLDRPVKKEEGLSIRDMPGRILTVIPGSLTITEKKKHDPKKPHDSPVKRMEIPVRLVPAQEIMGQIKPMSISGIKKEPLLEEDIYEFKEPEPFELSDIRSRKEGKGKATQCVTELETKIKKKGRQIKEGEEMEIDVTGTPQRSVASQESTAKYQDINEAFVKKEIRDYNKRTPESLKSPNDKGIKENEDLRNISVGLHIKEVPSGSGLDKPYVIDFFSKDKPIQRMPIDLKDLKFDISDPQESHFISSSVVITPKKVAIKKDSPGSEGSLKSPLRSTPDLSPSEKVTPNKDHMSKICAVDSSGKVKPFGVTIEKSHSGQVSTRLPGSSGHVMPQVVMPPVDSRVLAKPLAKQPFEMDRSFNSNEASVHNFTSGKSDEKSDGKLMPFSQRQQHIFPHLLNRPETSDEKQDELSIQRTTTSSFLNQSIINAPRSPPVISVPETTIVAANNISPKSLVTETEKKSESTVGESIEAVILRARQDKIEDEKKDPPKGTEKRRRNPGRSKKTLSRELIPDTSEESDTDSKSDKGDHRPKRRVGDGMKYSPAKKGARAVADIDKKVARRCDEEERANDADEEDNEGNFVPHKASSREGMRRRKEADESEHVATQREVRSIKKKRMSVASRRTDDGDEAGFGDLLCEETIPPGSPMPQDNLVIETESSPHLPSSVKQEMPFASVPTGSSFSKRTTTSHPTLQPSLQMSLQQLHPSVSVQSISKPPSSTPSPSPGITSSLSNQANTTIISSESLPITKIFAQNFRSQSAVPGPKPLQNKPRVDILPRAQSKSGSSFIPDIAPAATSSTALPEAPPRCEHPKFSPHRRLGPLASVDHTPPTTPESLLSNLSDSPRRETEKFDEQSTMRHHHHHHHHQYSSEIDNDSKADNSEDSNTMDSNLSCSKPESSRRGPTLTSRLPAPQSHSEGWDTEDGYPLPQKKKKRSLKIGDEDKESLIQSAGSKRRRRRYSSSRAPGKAEEEADATHGLNTLSMAACHSSRGRIRYNFCQELDPDLDASKRIALLQSRMQELKRTYSQVKSELASIERKRKKLRKKEREKEAQNEGNIP